MNDPENPTASDRSAPERRGFATRQLHAGQERADPTTGARAVPIYATSSYVFESADHAEALYAGTERGNQYGRMHNPTVQAFVDRLVALEGGVSGVALASGQAATTATLLALARPGANLVASREMFGGTFSVFRKLLEPWGCELRVVVPTAEAVAAACDANTVGVWVETIANPSGTVPDLPRLAEAAHAAGAPLLVDNTWGCGGYLCRPLALGADAVVHSATKWIGGHGTFVGGAVVVGDGFAWDEARFPAFHAPDARGRSAVDKAGGAALGLRVYELGLFTMGMTLSPHDAFLALQGLETLSLRVDRSCASALELARWLEPLPEVRRVLYPGLPSHPSFEVAERLLGPGRGAVLALELATEADARAFLDALELVSHLANIGDAKSVAIHPWSTTHAPLPEEARRAAGVTPELVRLSVGLEDLADLRADLAQALAAAPAGR